jgi:transcription antitermination factor NusG
MKQQQYQSEWYVLYTRPRFEKQICREIQFLNYESYLPLRIITRRWSDRVKKIEEPLFYSYVFTKTDIRYRVDLLQIPGVVRFVSTEGKPATIPVNEIDRIRLIESQGRNIQNESYYQEGDKVRVKHGVFAGMEGILLRKINRQPRFVLRLPLLQQAISVEISIDDLVKIN